MFAQKQSEPQQSCFIDENMINLNNGELTVAGVQIHS